MIFKFVEAITRFRKVRRTLGFKSGGVYKRIDENRELLEVLNAKVPRFPDGASVGSKLAGVAR
jgi:hypothetical protein